MAAIATLGDLLDHGGSIIEASPNRRAGGKFIARKGDRVLCAKHGPQTIVQGSSKVLYNGKGAARIGDLCSCGARIIGAGVKVNAGD